MEIEGPKDRKLELEPNYISVTVSEELLNRLEPVPDQEGPPLRYRFRRDVIERLSEVVFALPAPIEESQDEQEHPEWQDSAEIKDELEVVGAPV